MGLIRRNGKWIDDGKPSPYAKAAPIAIPKETPKASPEEIAFHAGAYVPSKPKGKPGRPRKERPKVMTYEKRKEPKRLPVELPKAMFNAKSKERLTNLQRDEIREAHRDEIRASMGLKPFNGD